MNDVTDQVSIGGLHNGILSLEKCICGEIFKPYHLVILDDQKKLTACPHCGRQYFFKKDVRVYLVESNL